MKRIWIIFSLLLLTALSCQETSQSQKSRQKGPIQVITTTGMIADAAQNIGKEYVQVTALMGPGVDPHLYKASQGDVTKLNEADLILYNGLNLEGKMQDIFVKMARNKPVFAVSEKIDPKILREPPEFLGHYDPHIWFDVSLWREVALYTGEILAQLDAAQANFYRQNAQRYAAELSQLHEEVKKEIAKIPPSQRLLLTAHDAFGYFGRAYAIEVRGLQGISTVSEYGLKDLQNLVNLIVEKKIKAVFVESSVPRKSIEALVSGCQAKGHQVKIGGTLFSDAMGQAGTAEGTYLGMVRYNVKTIVRALE